MALQEYTIPGFSRYTIDDELVVRSYTGIQTYIVKPKQPQMCINIVSDDCPHRAGKMTFSLARLYFCALHGIDPRYSGGVSKEVVGDKLFTFVKEKQKAIRNGTQRVVTETIGIKERRKKSTEELQAERIDRNVRWLNEQKRAIETRYFGGCVRILNEFRTGVQNYLMNRFDCSFDTAKEMFSRTIDYTIQQISKRGRIVNDPFSFLIRMSREVYRTRRDHYGR